MKKTIRLGIFVTAALSCAQMAAAQVPQSAPLNYQTRAASSDPDVLGAWPELTDIQSKAPDLFASMTHYVAQATSAYGTATFSMVIGGGRCGTQACELRVFMPGQPPMTVPVCSDPTAHYVTEDGMGIVACGQFISFDGSIPAAPATAPTTATTSPNDPVSPSMPYQ